MLNRSPDLRSTPIGQSLEQLAGRLMSKHLWRALGQAASALQLNGRAERCVAGTFGSGYRALWVLTTSDLLALTERPDASRIIPLTQIAGVARPIPAVLRVLVSGADSLALRLDDPELDAFADALTRRANVPVAGVEGLFADGRFVRFRGDVTRIAGEYIGGFRDLPAGDVIVMFDDAGVHIAPGAEPWRRIVALPWEEMREIAVEGHEETRQRVTLGRFALLGPLAMAVPKEENASVAYVTLVADSGDVIVRIRGAAPPAIRGRRQDVRRRVLAHAADEPEIGLADQLARLGELHAAGVLTAEEFAAAKRKVIGT